MNRDRDLHFRGGRDYLQSATLFDDLAECLPADAGGVDFSFKKKTDRQVRYQSDAPTDESTLVATWRDERRAVYVVEREDAISDRREYDEASLVARFSFRPDGVFVPDDIEGYSVMEAAVAAFKALLHRTVATHKPKVVFVRVRLRSMPKLPLEVRFSRRIGEFYQGDIIAGGQPVGQIFFGEWT